MTIVSRTIRSIPYRSAAETWALIVDLIAPTGSEARAECLSVAGTACSLIAEETMTNAPAVVYGSGPRVRIYCLYGNAALEGDNASEGGLPFTATNGDWKMSIPSPEADLTWVEGSLRKKSKRITARNHGSDVEEPEEKLEAKSLTADKEAFLRL